MAKDDGKNAMPSKEQGIEELRYIQQVYQNQYAMVGNSINMALQELQELNAAQKTLENMDLVEGKDILTNIGAQFFALGRVQNPKSVIVGVGADYFVEKDIDLAKTHAASYIQERTDRLNKLTKNRKELEGALIEISYKMESLMV